VPVRADRDRFVQWFFDYIPRPDFDEAMELSGNKRFYRLHDALHDDAYRNTSPGTLCRKFGISWLDLMDLWRQYNTACGLIHVATHLPQIMEDVVEDALSHEAMCSRCDGMGTVEPAENQRPCRVCNGLGRVRVPGHEPARRLVLKALGLTQA
jgi:hypothetical protein